MININEVLKIKAAQYICFSIKEFIYKVDILLRSIY